ncbi:MAG: hypothetical protein DRR19_29335 [Candidatus Parabeggiatoa sp. nov. 1]|nr:MAG: hypothetical protein DRR19_29335 [Gammaproteobacteria bacterium]
MKPIAFFLIGVLLLLLAFFYQPLYTLFPETFEPVYQFLNQMDTDILYIAGFLALIIALFDALPTLLSVPLFLALAFAGGYFLGDMDISIMVGDWAIL